MTPPLSVVIKRAALVAEYTASSTGEASFRISGCDNDDELGIQRDRGATCVALFSRQKRHLHGADELEHELAHDAREGLGRVLTLADR
jgi:hypothetical protein